MGFLPNRSRETKTTDGKFRQCPHCNEPLAIYRIFKANEKAARSMDGYICTECGLVCLNRKELNEAIEIFGSA